MNPVEFVEEVCRRSVAYGVMDTAKLRGWANDEIVRAETLLRLRLPAPYRLFLGVLGKNGGGLMSGTHLFPRNVDDFAMWRTMATQLLRASDETLSDDTVVFGDHQGYQFWYFIVDPADDDPPVFYYHEGDERARKVSGSFTAFVLNLVEECHRDKQWLEVQQARTAAVRAAYRAEQDRRRGSS